MSRQSGDGPRVGSKEFLDERGIKAWAGVPMEVIQRAMAPDQCLDSRLRHAMILWSWCGPEASEAVVRKDTRGYIVRDGAGRPVLAQFKDLVALLGLAPGMKGHVSRIAQGMVAQDLLRIERKTMYLVFRPAAFDPTLPVASTGNWSIAGVVVNTGNLPDDPVARADAIRFLEVASTRWKTELREVKTRNRLLLRQGFSGHGILMEKSKKSLREEKARADKPFSPVEEAPVTEEPARLPGPFSSPVREKLRTWLTATFRVPTPLRDDVLNEIAAYVIDEQVFAQFQDAAGGAKPRGWKLFVTIARECAEHHVEYAMAAGGSPRRNAVKDGAEEMRRVVHDRMRRGEPPL